MSRELSISYQGSGANIYVVIRDTADDTAWSVTNSALEAWSDGSLSTYVTNLTDRGGDRYDGDMPSGLPAGDYQFFYYERAGASPATDDLKLKSPTLHWDGAALGSSSSVSLSAYALTDLDSAKRRLGITDSNSDTLITEIINSVSAEIERIAGVWFKSRDYREWYNGARQREMLLKHYPIQTPPRIAFGVGNAMTLTYTGAGIRATAGVFRNPELWDDGGLRLETIATNGTPTVTTLAFATYKSVTALVTAIGAVSGWSATTLINQPTGDLHPGNAEDALNRTVTLTYPDQVDYSYNYNASNGKVRFDNLRSGIWLWWDRWSGCGDLQMPRQWQRILVQYRGGFETIPADVQLVCNEIVADTYSEAQIGRGVNEVKLGSYLIRLDRTQIDDLRDQLANYIDNSTLIGEA